MRILSFFLLMVFQFSWVFSTSFQENNDSQPQVHAFVTGWDDTSLNSLQENISKIDTLIFVESSLGSGGQMIQNFPEQFRKIHEFVDNTKPEVNKVLLLNNFSSTRGIWDQDIMKSTLLTKKSRTKLQNSIVKYLKEHHFNGILMDFEDFTPEVGEYYQTFLMELSSKVKDKYSLSVSLPIANENIQYDTFAQYVDKVFIMAYDKHVAKDSPGPISPMPWFTQGITNIQKYIPNDKISVIIGNYGYDWNKSLGTRNDLTFQDTMNLMKTHSGDLRFDTEMQNPYFSYSDESEQSHIVYYLDAVSGYNQLKTLHELGIEDVGIWRLGSEDPSIWKILPLPYKYFAHGAYSLKYFSYGFLPDIIEKGDSTNTNTDTRDGYRSIYVNHKIGIIISEKIVRYPTVQKISK